MFTRIFFGIGILGLLILGGYGLWFMNTSVNTSAQEDAAEYICAFVRIYHDQSCQPSFLIDNHMDALTACHRRIGKPEAQDGPQWLRCVENQGVVVVGSQ